MNYLKLETDSMVNGTGLRVVLWVSGCSHGCVGCHNPHTHNPKAGVPFTEQTIKEVEELLNKDYIQGLTISGGDPFHPNNQSIVFILCRHIKDKFPDKNIWVYTGYSYEDIKTNTPHLLYYVDVLIDGKFVLEQKNTSLHYKGSSNQRIIDVKKSFDKGEIVLMNV